MAKAKNSEKKETVRPILLKITVDAARALVARKYGQKYADALGDGDVVDLAMQIQVSESE